MDEYARLAAEDMELNGLGHGRTERSSALTRSRLFSVAPHLAADLDEAGIAKLVRIPTMRHFVASALKEAHNMVRSHAVLLMFVVLFSIGSVGGIIGGLTTLQVQGACGVIAAHHVERTVRIAPSEGLDFFANVIIDHQWPRGSVEVVADTYTRTNPFGVGWMY